MSLNLPKYRKRKFDSPYIVYYDVEIKRNRLKDKCMVFRMQYIFLIDKKLLNLSYKIYSSQNDIYWKLQIWPNR